jgi:hypothetical protein
MRRSQTQAIDGWPAGSTAALDILARPGVQIERIGERHRSDDLVTEDGRVAIAYLSVDNINAFSGKAARKRKRRIGDQSILIVGPGLAPDYSRIACGRISLDFRHRHRQSVGWVGRYNLRRRCQIRLDRRRRDINSCGSSLSADEIGNRARRDRYPMADRNRLADLRYAYEDE